MRSGPDGWSTTSTGTAPRSRDERDRLLDASQQLLAVCTPDGTIRMANAASVRLTGRPPDVLRATSLFSLIHDADRESAALHWRRLAQDGWTGFESRVADAGEEKWLLWRCTAADGAVYASAIDITDRKRFEQELWDAHAENERLLNAITSILVRTDAAGLITRWNGAAEAAFGVGAAAALGEPLATVVAWGDSTLREALEEDLRETRRLVELRVARDDGGDRFVTLRVTPLRRGADVPDGFLVLGTDVTEHRLLEAQLRQAQKLEAIGQLASGIAHEINTPTQYVGDNVRFLRDAFRDLAPLLDGLCALAAPAAAGGLPAADLVDRLVRDAGRVDLEFIGREVPLAVAQSLEGIGRVTTIVRAMKEFSHPRDQATVAVDLNRAVETTLIVARNTLKSVADVTVALDPALPPVPCLPGEINQVILNLLVNAGDAIEDAAGGHGGRGMVTVTTSRDGDWAELRVTDTGCGIPEALRSRVFEPFFTTKDVGRGTGQGLAIAHAVVVKKHGGEIRFEPAAGGGTTFIVRLPLTPASATAGSLVPHA